MDELLKIRPIYKELRGYLEVAPNPEKKSRIFDLNSGEQLNRTIDELNGATNKNYDKFKVHSFQEQGPTRSMYRNVIRTQDYVDKLSGLINRLQGEYPLEDQITKVAPTTVFNANQIQSQSQQQSIAVDFAILVGKRQGEFEVGTPERNFLDKLGDALKTAQGIKEIIQSILSIAGTFNISLEVVKRALGL